MLEFKLPEMTCGHCVKAVTAAVQAVDPAAQVEIDLPQHRLRVQSSQPRERIVAELVEAGYTPAGEPG
jgi:copper chaperone